MATPTPAAAAATAAAQNAWHAPLTRPAAVPAPKPMLKPGKLATVARVAGADGVFADPSLDAVVVPPVKVG